MKLSIILFLFVTTIVSQPTIPSSKSKSKGYKKVNQTEEPAVGGRVLLI